MAWSVEIDNIFFKIKNKHLQSKRQSLDDDVYFFLKLVLMISKISIQKSMMNTYNIDIKKVHNLNIFTQIHIFM